jgi:Family of unknown function (DUF6680)
MQNIPVVPPHYWGLTVAEWLTIAAILLGPILAVATQLWMQARKAQRDAKLWVFNQLMAHRAQPINVNFVQAFNLIDAVFYNSAEVRQKRKDFMDVAGLEGRDLTAQELEKIKDLVAEMLAKMGNDLGFEFDHTEIKNTGYYPKGFVQIDTEQAAVRAKVIEVLDGKPLKVVVKEEPPRAAMLPPGAVRRN